MRTRTYSEMARIGDFEGRFEYLKLGGNVGRETFGFDRYINQSFYSSREWRTIRNEVIARDGGCDLGIQGHEIHTEILVHHMNPITPEQIIHDAECILDPELLITTTKRTHNAIHFGDSSILPKPLVERARGDTRLW